jgi:hypothetical protein
LATEQDMIAAWETAGRELGVRVVSPVEVDGTSFPVLVEQFGSQQGALPLLLGDEERFGIAERAGYFASLLNPETYCTFDRKRFEDTLNDWQWFGEGRPPRWYTGEAWG